MSIFVGGLILIVLLSMRAFFRGVARYHNVRKQRVENYRNEDRWR